MHTFMTIAENNPGRTFAITPPSNPPALFTCAPMLEGLVNPADNRNSAHACPDGHDNKRDEQQIKH